MTLATVLLMSTFGGQATAQAPDSKPAPQVQMAAPDAPQRMYRGSQVLGAAVRDLEGRALGTIHDLILGSRRGEIAYAVVASRGVMGVGKTFHAVPWATLEPRSGGRHYVLNADLNTLRAAPGFDLARWPDLADSGWRAEVESYWARAVGHAVSAGNEAPAAPQSSGGGAAAD